RRALGGLIGAKLVTLAWLAAPLALRPLSVFRVRQLELVGVRNLAPDAVIAALRLEPGASVFGDTRLLADRVRSLAGVAEARVVRHLPAALTVELREVEPAALTPGPHGTRLVAVDGAGHALPFDPARSGLDLPIAASGDSGVAGGRGARGPGPPGGGRARSRQHQDVRRHRRGGGGPAAAAARQGAGGGAREERGRAPGHGARYRRDEPVHRRGAARCRADGRRE